MNISYLLSVIDLYLKKTYEELNIEVIKYDGYIKFNFFYTTSSINKTYISIDMNTFYNFAKTIFNNIQKKENITEEFIDENNNYVIKFKNKIIKFSWFNNEELQKIRSNFITNNAFVFNTITNENEKYEDKLINNKDYKLSFSFGFTSFITIFLSAIWFLDIFMIALWIFKIFK